MFEDLILFIALYFIFKIIKSLSRGLFPKKTTNVNYSNNAPKETRYTDVEEVEFKEIKDEPDKEDK